jgi:hypothetical protein
LIEREVLVEVAAVDCNDGPIGERSSLQEAGRVHRRIESTRQATTALSIHGRRAERNARLLLSLLTQPVG